MKIPRVGQVMRSPSGALRVVRKVTINDATNPYKVSIAFVIRRCSWTRRCYTNYNLGELTRIGYVLTRAKYKPSKLDQRINDAIERNSREMTCCDVEGIA